MGNDAPVTPDPATSMRLASSGIYPELCDLQYVICGADGCSSSRKQLSVLLIGNYNPLPSRPEWYKFETFCKHNKPAIDEVGAVVGMEVRYKAAAFHVHDAASWQAMLNRIDEVLAQQRSWGRQAQPSLLEFHPKPTKPSIIPQQIVSSSARGADQCQLKDRQERVAYRWTEAPHSPSSENAGRDAVGEDDEWAACCEFMLHPYNKRSPQCGKLLLGTASAITPDEMMSAYRFLSRVAINKGGAVVQTIGQLGTLRTQLAITCILRLVVLCKQHYYQNPQQHKPIGINSVALVMCGASNPFGIQCVCRPGSIAQKLASVVGNTRRPFIYLARAEAVDRCYEAMNAFLLRRLPRPLNYPMLVALKYNSLRLQQRGQFPPSGRHLIMRHILSGEREASIRSTTNFQDRNQFIIILSISGVADALISSQGDRLEKDSWLWQACHSLCTCILDWQLPKPDDDKGFMASEAVIKWALRMRFATPGEMGFLSITTPGEVLHRDELRSCRALLLAIAPLPRRSRNRWRRGETTAARYRRYGFVLPSKPDVSFHLGAGSGHGGSRPSPAVTVQHLLLPTPPISDVLDWFSKQQIDTSHDLQAARDLAQALHTTSVATALTADNYKWLGGAGAQFLNAIELLRPTPDNYHEVFRIIMDTTAMKSESNSFALMTRVLDESAAVKLLLQVIIDNAKGDSRILVLANNQTMAHAIANYINQKKHVDVKANILSDGWLNTDVVSSTHKEAVVRKLATTRGEKEKVLVIVAGPEAMDSGWLSMDYIDCCVVFGAPFSPLPLRSMVQAVCGNGDPRDVRIIHIGLAGNPNTSLNALMRHLCMEQLEYSYGLGINNRKTRI